MQRSYLVKSPVHFADFGFFVKAGDILVHDTSNSNRLTVYRNGEVVKAVTQTALGLAAMQKSGFIEEVTQTAKVAPKAPTKPVDAPKPAPKREEPKPAPKPVLKPTVKFAVNTHPQDGGPQEIAYEEPIAPKKSKIEEKDDA
jgi:hypothetical protein